MLWFIGQSWVLLATAFLLGLLVGYLWWGMLWRRVQVDESRAVRAERQKHANNLIERDRELAILRERVEKCDLEHLSMLPVVATAAVPDSALALPEPEPVTEQIPIIEIEPITERIPVLREPEPEPAEAATEPMAEPIAPDDPVVDAEPERDDEPVVAEEALTEAEPEPVVAAVPAPKPLRTYIPSQPKPTDDLERIEGIGPQMSGALKNAGIHTYAELAAADETTLRDAIEARGLRFAPSLVTWGRQAQLLAEGDEDGFADLTRRLVSGRDEGRE